MSARLVLASGSGVRAMLLRNAGLDFDVQPADVDEDAIKQAFSDLSPEDLALKLAEEKALAISAVRSGDLVIGADQILECDGVLFDKPKGYDGARDHMNKLRGRTHRLIAASCVAEGGEILWRNVEEARLTMRDFSDEFLDHYLATAGDGILASVGAYRLEEMGIQLFEKIDGDQTTILGLPLLPLFGFLRGRDVMAG
jgi:septum formation protein